MLLVLLLCLAVDELHLLDRGGHLFAGAVDLGLHIGDERLGVLRLGEETDVVLQQAYLLFELAHLVVKALALRTQAVAARRFERRDLLAETVHRTVALRTAQRVEQRIDGGLVFLLDGILLLDGHEPDLAPAALELADHVVSAGLDVGRGHLIEQGEFLPEVLLVLAVHTGKMRSLALEELVACGTETLPDRIRMAARHGTDLLPAGLQGDQLVGGLLPLLAVHQRLGGLAYLGLQLQVVLHLGLHPGIELPLGLEELVACRAETLVDTVVVLLGCEADGFPGLLDLQQAVARTVPLLAGRERLCGQLLGGGAKLRLEFEVLDLLALERFEMLLMLFVDTARRRLEALPEHLFIFIGYGARLAPLVMQLLQLVERLHDRRLQHQRFGLLAEGDLLLVVLLQVEVAQLLVDFDEAVDALQHVFGIVGICPMVQIEDNGFDDLAEQVIKYIDETYPDKNFTFKVMARRARKNYPMDSMKINAELGGRILDAFEGVKVDVHNPDVYVNIEINKDDTYIYFNDIKGLGGYPVGVQKKGLLMLSGGIDSPVAGYLALKRGIKLDAIYFEAIPHTSLNAREKVISLANELLKYTTNINLYVVPITKLQESIYKNIDSTYMITILRRMMYRIAEKIAEEKDYLVLINGESIGQVASQTLSSINVINKVVNIPIIRPVACFDKLEIIDIAKRINTYNISILPYEDCCTVFVPKHPVINPKLEKCEHYESLIDYKTMIDECIKNTFVVKINDNEEINDLL